MSNLSDFILGVAKKAGIPESDEAIVALMQRKELTEITMPEEFDKVVNSSLINIKDAKNNHGEIRNHYFPIALSPIDKAIEKMVDEYGIDQDARAEILSEGSTYKRLPLLVAKLQESYNKKNTTDKDKAASWSKQIDELNAKLREAAGQRETLEQEFNKKLVNYKIDSKKDLMLSTYKTTFDDLPSDVKNITLRQLLNKELQDNGAELTFDENDNFILRKRDGSNYHSDSNQLVDAQQFIEGTLSKNKVLKTVQHTPEPNPQPINRQTGQSQPQGGNGNKDIQAAAIMNNNLESLKAFAASS